MFDDPLSTRNSREIKFTVQRRLANAHLSACKFKEQHFNVRRSPLSSRSSDSAFYRAARWLVKR